MGESRGSESGGVVGERLIAAIHPSAGPESVDSPLVFGDEDEMGPFKVAEVGKSEQPVSWWGKHLSGRSSAIGVGVAAGLVLTVTSLLAVGRGDSASEIGSVLLPSGWVGSGGMDSTDGGVDSSGGRSTFSRLFFGGESGEEEEVTEGPTTEALEGDTKLVDDVDDDGAAIERPDELSEAGAEGDGEMAEKEDSPTTSALNSTSSTSVSSEETTPTSSAESTTRPPSTSSTTPSSSTTSETSTTSKPTATTTTSTTTSTTTTTTVVSVAAPTGCEVQTTTAGVRTTGVEIHEPSEDFAEQYVLFDEELNEVIRVSNPQQVEGDEIEFESEPIGFDPDIVFYAAAVEDGIVSELTQCTRRV